MVGTAQLSEVFAKVSGALRLGGDSTAVGLSIGSSSTKLIELRRAGKGWRLLHFGVAQLPEDAVVDREIGNPIPVVDSIRSLTGQIQLKTKNVCTSLSGTSLIIKRMSLVVPNPRELKEQVFWEAEQYLPFDVTEVVMDYQVLSRGKDATTDVLLIAVKRSTLDSYMGCVADAGLKAKVVDTDYFALQNVFEANYSTNPGEAVAIVDLGASALKIVVVSDGVPVYTKDAALGGRVLTAEIQRQLNLSYLDAETLKTGGQGEGMPAEVSELVHVMAENFAGEIKRALDFYNASSAGAPVSYLLLTGGGARIAELPRLVEESTRLGTQLLNPFTSIAYDPAVFSSEYITAIAPLAAVPVGLALRAGAGA
jgi:type IV pilus assembly protein PilM